MLRSAWILPLLFLPACIQVDQTITLNDDGSGGLKLRYGMSRESIKQMQVMAHQAMEEEGITNDASFTMPFDLDEADVRKEFEDYRPYGVTLQAVRNEESNGWKYIEMDVQFSSLEGLVRTEFIADRNLTLARNEEGNYVFRQAAPSVEGSPLEGMAGTGDEAFNDEMANVMQGFRAVLRVNTPGDILESNATETNGRCAVWVFDASEDSNALKKVQQLDLRVVFDGKAIHIPEFKGADESVR